MNMWSWLWSYSSSFLYTNNYASDDYDDDDDRDDDDRSDDDYDESLGTSLQEIASSSIIS